MTEKISFAVDGSFITELARTKCYDENKIKDAIDLLMAMTETDEISEEERIGICISILDGKSEIQGISTGSDDDDYGLVKTPEKESLGFWKHISDLSTQIEELTEKNRELNDKMSDLYKE